MSQMAQTTLGESTTVELALNLNDESHGLIHAQKQKERTEQHHTCQR